MSIVPGPFESPSDGNLDLAVIADLVINLQIDFLSPDGNFAHQGYDPARPTEPPPGGGDISVWRGRPAQ